MTEYLLSLSNESEKTGLYHRARIPHPPPPTAYRWSTSWEVASTLALPSHVPSPLLQNPTVMPGTGFPPAMMAKVKEAMTSTSEKILRLRSAHFRVP